MSAGRPFDALILDFGAILIKTPFEVLDAVERALGLPPGALPWRGPLDPATDPLWQDMLADRLSERDYWAQRAAETGRLVGEVWDTRELMIRCADIMGAAWFRVEFDALLDEARAAGLRTGVLTNELDLFHGAGWRDGVSSLRRIDALVDATHTHILKPDPRAYQLALRALGVEAGRALFVDDQWRNVKGAEAVGMAALHFDIRQPDAMISRIRHLLGLSPEPAAGGGSLPLRRQEARPGLRPGPARGQWTP